MWFDWKWEEGLSIEKFNLKKQLATWDTDILLNNSKSSADLLYFSHPMKQQNKQKLVGKMYFFYVVVS